MATDSEKYTIEQEAILSAFYKNLIYANQILHKRGVVDAYGHVSARHPFKPDVMVMAKYLAPGNVSSRADLVEYWIKDASAVDPSSPKGYSERCIHSEAMKAYEAINAVIHSHCEDVTPFSMSGVPMRPCSHQAGFLGGHGTPIFDIAKYYQPGDRQNLLVNNTRFGAALASYLRSSKDSEPDHSVVLMRGHGFTVVGGRIEDAVKRAIYVQTNAKMQTIALTTRAAYISSATEAELSDLAPIQYLSAAEADGASERNYLTALRPWKLWCREVDADSLYTVRLLTGSVLHVTVQQES